MSKVVGVNIKAEIRKALKVQQTIEGYTPEIGLLLKILPRIKMKSEWTAITRVGHHRYGKMSYEVHLFYYPSDLLINLEQHFEGSSNA